MTNLIELLDIRKHFQVGGTQIEALRGINLTIECNEFAAVLGASGSGKSTMMSILGCLDWPTSGIYMLNDRNVASMDSSQLANIRNREIGFIFQSFNLLPRSTALQNVMQPLVYRGLDRRTILARSLAALERVGLADRKNHLPSELSGGQCQRVAVARAICAEPSILLADEPTGNLDSGTAADIMELFAELHSGGQTVIIVTHDQSVADRCKRRIVLSDGVVVPWESN